MKLNDFLTAQQQASVVDAVRLAEKGTSGEIRIHIDRECKVSPMERAKEVFNKLKERFVGALNGDLNTSLAVTALYDVLKAKCNDATKLAALADFDQVMCLDLLAAAEKLVKKQAEKEAANADPEIDALVAARTEAKKAKNFAEADRIRDELKARGIEIIDTPQGAKWRKV